MGFLRFLFKLIYYIILIVIIIFRRTEVQKLVFMPLQQISFGVGQIGRIDCISVFACTLHAV